MSRPAKCMQKPTDDRLREALEAGLSLTLAVITANNKRSRQHLTRLSELRDHDRLDRPKREYCEITGDGRNDLSGELASKHLEDE